MKIITNKRQKEIDEMMIKKLRFVARETLSSTRNITLTKEDLEVAMFKAEQVYYADNVI